MGRSLFGDRSQICIAGPKKVRQLHDVVYVLQRLRFNAFFSPLMNAFPPIYNGRYP